MDVELNEAGDSPCLLSEAGHSRRDCADDTNGLPAVVASATGAELKGDAPGYGGADGGLLG